METDNNESKTTFNQSATVAPLSLGLRFRNSDKLYPIRLSQKYDLPKIGSYLVVETSKGVECGEILAIPGALKSGARKDLTIQKIIRQASVEDLTSLLKLPEVEQELALACSRKISEYNLPIKLVKTERLFDGNKVYYHYSYRDEEKDKHKVNLRDIVRDLTKEYEIKVEFVPLSGRSEAKVTGGLGHCGQGLCCSSWLPRPRQVTIKMAKEQGVPINIQKISGVCGRLQCCIQYETDNYVAGKLVGDLNKEKQEE